MRIIVSPYGDYNNAVVKTAKKCGYYTIQWDVDTLVTEWKPLNRCFRELNMM